MFDCLHMAGYLSHKATAFHHTMWYFMGLQEIWQTFVVKLIFLMFYQEEGSHSQFLVWWLKNTNGTTVLNARIAWPICWYWLENLSVICSGPLCSQWVTMDLVQLITYFTYHVSTPSILDKQRFLHIQHWIYCIIYDEALITE